MILAIGILSLFEPTVKTPATSCFTAAQLFAFWSFNRAWSQFAGRPTVRHWSN